MSVEQRRRRAAIALAADPGEERLVSCGVRLLDLLAGLDCVDAAAGLEILQFAKPGLVAALAGQPAELVFRDFRYVAVTARQDFWDVRESCRVADTPPETTLFVIHLHRLTA